MVVCKRNQVARSLQKSDGTSGNNQESAEAGGSGAAGAAGDDSRRLRDGDDGSGRGASRDGAVVSGPGRGVARAAGIANSGGDLLDLGGDPGLLRGGRSGRSGSGGGSDSLETTSNGVSGGALSEVHVVGAAPGLFGGVVGAVVALVAGLARAVLAAALFSSSIEAVSEAILGGALFETGAAGLGAGVAVAALGLLGLVAHGVAAHEAQARHGGQAVWLGFGSGESGAGGHDSERSEVHLDDCW